MSRTAVTGATGQIGRRVARRLASAGIPQRLVVRDVARAPELAGAEVAQASYDDRAALVRAFTGIDTLFLVSASEDADRVRQHINALDAAAEAGVERVVYLSFLAAAPDATFTFARDHAATERHARELGLRHTFLRDAFYTDFLPTLAGADGVIRGPAGDGAFTPVTRDDVADVAAAVLRSGAYDGATLDVTGPDRLTMGQLAALLTDVCGRPVRYAEETLEEAYASRASYGAPPFEVDGWVSTYAAVAAGELDVLSSTVRDVTGREPAGVREFLERNPASWQHLL
jgi:NAD(P)H dehydrogenase (quinone)